jgi:hypothetical protein
VRWKLLDHAVRQLERGEASAIELIDTLLAEELSVRETSPHQDGPAHEVPRDNQDPGRLGLLLSALA